MPGWSLHDRAFLITREKGPAEVAWSERTREVLRGG
jgi:hypothetical protein